MQNMGKFNLARCGTRGEGDWHPTRCESVTLIDPNRDDPSLPGKVSLK
jgi:hypothetical protein